MKRSLGTLSALLVLLLAAGCGDDADTRADDPGVHVVDLRPPHR